MTELAEMMRVDPSHHAQRGMAVCTLAGQIVWVGPIARLTEAGLFEIVHCHEDDAADVQKWLKTVTQAIAAGKRA